MANDPTKPVKKTTYGLEVEFFTLNSEGKMVSGADELFKTLEKNKKLRDKVREEISFSMFEVGTNPQNSISNLAVDFLGSLNKILEFAEKDNLHLLPLGCYPAASKPKQRQKPWYDAYAFIFDKKTLPYVMKVCGFHFHYSLPKGVVEKKTESIKRLRYSEAKDVFLNLYNFSVAAEPVCMTFCQSSPFVDGKHYGKDCRTLLYRDLSIPGEIYGMYEKLPILGGLPHYEFTLEDLRDLSSRRKNLYLDILRSNGFPTNEIAPESDLKFMWGPIRVNRIGTLEHRGLDMNYPKYLFSTGLLFESALEGIQDRNLQMLPSDIGIDEPFKIEDDVVYIPPFSIVKSMELLSSRYGFDNSAVYSYCSALFNFVSKISRKKSSKKLSLVKDILEKKKTMSDEILTLVKKNGYDPKNVPDDFLRYIASYYSKGLRKEVDSSMKILSSF